MWQSKRFKLSRMDFRNTQKQVWKAFHNKDLQDFKIALNMGADPMLSNGEDICIYEKVLSTFGYADFVKECIKSGCSPHYINQNISKAAINYAADSKDPNILKTLLKYPNIMVNHKFNNITPLMAIYRNANYNDAIDNIVECVKSLINSGASPFMDVVWESQHQKKFLDYNANLSLNDKIMIYELMFFEYASFEVGQSGGDQEHKAFGQFMRAIKYGEKSVIKSVLGQASLDFNINCAHEQSTPLQQAIKSGNSYALKKLLEAPTLDFKMATGLLHLAITCLKENFGNSRLCFFLLLNSDKFDVNEVDEDGTTPLHVAVYHRNNEAIIELLKRKAFIGAQNKDGKIAIDGIDPEILMECFNDGISTNGYDIGHSKFQLHLKYDNLMTEETSTEEEMRALAFMVQQDKYQQFLDHPLIMNFVRSKWSQLNVFFYLNLIIFGFFAVIIVSCALLQFSTTASKTTITVLSVISWFGIIYLILREFHQFCKSPTGYLRSAINCLELALIVCSIMICSGLEHPPQTQRILTVCLILLVAFELIMLLGDLPRLSISQYMLMFEEVCKTFLKCFMLYSILILTFSCCFYILIGSKQSPGLEDSDKFTKFATPWKAIVKTIVMLTGEFDAASIEMDDFVTTVLFLLFVFLMTMVLYNLLNGLAISDIETIRAKAKKNGMMSMINLLIRFEFIIEKAQSAKKSIAGEKLHKSDDIEQISLNADSESDDSDSDMDDDVCKLAMEILETKIVNSTNLHRVRGNDHRFNKIDNRLNELQKKIENFIEKNTFKIEDDAGVEQASVELAENVED